MTKISNTNIFYETLNSITHGVGTIITISASTVMLTLAFITHKPIMTITAIFIYSFSIISFLLISTLFHALSFTKMHDTFQFLDHIFIYFVILGTYTPYTWLFIPLKTGLIIWSIIIALSILGITYDFFFLGKIPWLSAVIYLILGWLIVLVLPELKNSLSKFSFITLVLGGITYSIGAFFYIFKKNPLNHVLWHIFVIIGVSFMYVSIFNMLFIN